jgi:hypothetical protein
MVTTQPSQFRSLLCAVLGCGAIIIIAASQLPATVLSTSDWQTSGDNLLLNDSSSGLQWLNLTVTSSLSYSAIQADLRAGSMTYGGRTCSLSGFTLASPLQVYALYADAGISGTGINLWAPQPAIDTLLAKWGTLSIDDYGSGWIVSSSEAYTSESSSSNPAPLAYLRGENIGVSLGDAAYVGDPANPPNPGSGFWPYSGPIGAALVRPIPDEPVLPGDANLDGTVNLIDLATVLTNYDKSSMAWSQGDFDANGTVEFEDLSKVLANFTKTVGASATSIKAVPEPSTITLLLAGAARLLAWRRRK